MPKISVKSPPKAFIAYHRSLIITGVDILRVRASVDLVDELLDGDDDDDDGDSDDGDGDGDSV